MKTALVTGLSGQDGSYLAELLLDKGYNVVGTTRASGGSLHRIHHLLPRIKIVTLDPLDGNSLLEIVQKENPDEIYNFGAMASSADLFESPEKLFQYNTLAVIRWLDAIQKVNSGIRFCQASSSEIFGNTEHSPQQESTCFRPRNPYGVAKLAAHYSVGNYRTMYGAYACSAILFNHESPRRNPELVTRKITKGVAAISSGKQRVLQLGNLEARRDWGFAKDYVHAMWLMLQQPVAEDFVIATGTAHSVREFCEIAFQRVGLDYRDHVTSDAVNGRSSDTATLVGDASKARRQLAWQTTISFEELVHLMVDEDVAGDTARGRV